MNKLYIVFALGVSVRSDYLYIGDCLENLDPQGGFNDLDCGDQCWETFVEYYYSYLDDGDDYDPYYYPVCEYRNKYDPFYRNMCTATSEACELYIKSDEQSCKDDMYDCEDDLGCYIVTWCEYVEDEGLNDYNECINELYDELYDYYYEYYWGNSYNKKKTSKILRAIIGNTEHIQIQKQEKLKVSKENYQFNNGVYLYGSSDTGGYVFCDHTHLYSFYFTDVYQWSNDDQFLNFYALYISNENEEDVYTLDEDDEVNTIGDTFTINQYIYAQYTWEGEQGVYFMLVTNHSLLRAIQSFFFVGIASQYL